MAVGVDKGGMQQSGIALKDDKCWVSDERYVGVCSKACYSFTALSMIFNVVCMCFFFPQQFLELQEPANYAW